MKILAALLLFLSFVTGQNKIEITKPESPKEVLPPKPVVVLPLIVKKWPKRKRLAIVRSGPDNSPYGFLHPPFYPSPLTYNGSPYNSKLMKIPTAPNPLRKLFQNVIYTYEKNKQDLDLTNQMLAMNHNPVIGGADVESLKQLNEQE